MPRALPLYAAALATCSALVLLTGCSPTKANTDTASAPTNAPDSSATAKPGARIVSLTTSSAEARDLYLKGRTLAEQLRFQDGRKLFEQAAAADPTFAMAHYQLAVTSATAKDFFAHLKEAVALSDKATDGERLMIRILEANGNAKPKEGLELTEQLVAKYPDDVRAHFLLGTADFGRQDWDRAIGEFQKCTTLDPTFSGAYNLLGYAYRA